MKHAKIQPSRKGCVSFYSRRPSNSRHVREEDDMSLLLIMRRQSINVEKESDECIVSRL